MIGMRKEITLSAALAKLMPTARWSVRDNDYDKIEWYSDDIEKPSLEELLQTMEQLREEEPYTVLREVRDWYLRESDWTQGADIRALRGPEWCTAWDNYRQKLRDMTTDFTPYFEGDSPEIFGVTLPEKPSA